LFRLSGLTDPGNGLMVAAFDTFQASGTFIGIFNDCMFVKEDIYFSKYMYRTGLGAFPASFALMRV
jgi:hypothetical protein